MVDNTYPEVGEFITFNDCSEDAYRIEINFGDGSFAKYAPVEHSYNKKGTYIASLAAWSEDGENKTKSIQLIIVGGDSTGTIPDTTSPNGIQPTACFSPSITVAEVGSDILFINCSLNASTFSWNFDDGTTSTIQIPVHSFSDPGTYDVMLTAMNANGSADTTIAIAIGQRILARIVLKNFNPLNPSGVAWDDLGFPIPGIPVEPDVYVDVSSASGSSLSTGIESNLQTTSLPVTWDVSSDNLALLSENWTITVYDDESFLGGSPEVMVRLDNIDLGTLGSNGLIQLSSGSFG